MAATNTSNNVGIDISRQEINIKKHEHIRGTCLMMCPNNEIRLRQRENLIHSLESKINAEGQRLGFGDSRRMVKEFHRSSAGHKILPSDVRPLPILKRTVNYLLNVVCTYEDVSWREIYDFVNDRLRAVRQDITVQGCEGKEVIEILAPAARFYVYAQYRLCEYGASEFDPHLNMIQLNEILLTILTMYKDSNYSIETEEITLGNSISKTESLSPEVKPPNEIQNLHEASFSDVLSSLENCHIQNPTLEDSNVSMLSLEDREDHCNELNPYTNIRCIKYSTDAEENNLRRITDDPPENLNEGTKYTVIEEMICLYLLIKIGNPQAALWVLELPKKIRHRPLLFRVMEANMRWMMGNHVPLARLSSAIAPTLALALHMHCNKIQRHALGVLSVAHSSKVLSYSTEDLQQHLLFSGVESVKKTCQYYGLEAAGDGICFLKTNFKWDIPVLNSEKAEWVETRLKDLTLAQLFFPYTKNED